ncbi:MAG: DUF4091 domain-containing protein [Planctomycetes bacterium]|nr:DUF4091 domain-containing protein [Planctomycetota bacterium]
MIAVLAALLAAADLLPNPSFEEGAGAPRGWNPASPEAVVSRDAARTGTRSIAIRGTARTSSVWRSDEIPVRPGCYRLSFWARHAPGTAGGCVVSGPDFMNRDFQAGEDWTRLGFVFPVPPGRASLAIRLGLWEKAGTVWFDDASLVPCVPVHRRIADRTLGAGESLDGKRYVFAPDFGGEGAGYARPLATWTCGFNSMRWTFGPGQSLVYRQEVGSAPQTAARVSVAVGYHTAGGCIVEASRDESEWIRAGAISGVDSKTFALPAALFPAPAVFVRLRSPSREEDGVAPGSFQIYTYRYEADLATDQGSLEGETRFLTIEEDSFPGRVEIADLGDLLPGGRNRVVARIRSAAPAARIEWETSASPAAATRRGTVSDTAAPIEMPYVVPDRGDGELAFAVSAGAGAFRARLPFSIPSLHATGYGEALASDERADWWWCQGGFRVGRARPAPIPKPERIGAIRIAAARGEMESFQLVVRPKRRLERVTVAVRRRGADPAPEVYEIAQVAYLDVKVPTDSSGCRGAWPDPLARLSGPIAIEPGANQPIWITLRIPRDLRAGDHPMAIEVAEAGRTIATFPLAVRVFEYEIPREHHLATAFGLSAGEIHRYHNLSSDEDRRRVWDLYMQNFRDHRISPYTFAPYDPIAVRFEGLVWEGGRRVEADPAEGKACLAVADDSPTETVSAEYAARIPIDAARPYVLRFKARADREGRRYLVTLTTYDARGAWISGHNIDLPFTGSTSWRSEEVRVVPAERSPDARSVRLSLRSTMWTDRGEAMGTAWFDDVFLAPAGGTENLLRNGGFEDVEEMVPRIDFSAWDAQAARYLDQFAFDGFDLPLQGLGGGTFHSRREGRIGPYAQGTPEYRRLFGAYAGAIQDHLEAKGWLKKAYIYWFDEPEEKDYAFVRAGMEEIRRAGPKIRRMLTEEPQPALFGAVDIWCPVLSAASPEAIRGRLDAGEDVWWYVCTGPRAPYPGLFIDHDAIELRIWLWMTWKYGVRGILVWQSNYWTSPCAYPKEPQNPWEDPMGYVSGYDHPPGFIGYWGNGDGRFIYPPNRDVLNDRRPYIEGPMDSIRWEMLREGIEDYEMFWLLRDLTGRARRAGAPEGEIRAAEALLEIPESIIRDRTHFTKDPRDLDGHRAKVAAAIERLSKKLRST